MMIAPEGPSALPLWINGHPFLTITPAFHTVTNPATGQALRLIPLCDSNELVLAEQSAQLGLAAWQKNTAEERAHALLDTANLLEKYTTHFAQILQEEIGLSEAAATEEVTAALASLKSTAESTQAPSIHVIISDASTPFAKPLKLITNVLAAGGCVIVKPSVKAPSALFAFAELTARAGIPAGVFNLIHGDDELIAAIAASTTLHQIIFVGEATLGEKIQIRLNPHAKALLLAQ